MVYIWVGPLKKKQESHFLSHWEPLLLISQSQRFLFHSIPLPTVNIPFSVNCPVWFHNQFPNCNRHCKEDLILLKNHTISKSNKSTVLIISTYFYLREWLRKSRNLTGNVNSRYLFQVWNKQDEPFKCINLLAKNSKKEYKNLKKKHFLK